MKFTNELHFTKPRSQLSTLTCFSLLLTFCVLSLSSTFSLNLFAILLLFPLETLSSPGFMYSVLLIFQWPLSHLLYWLFFISPPPPPKRGHNQECDPWPYLFSSLLTPSPSITSLVLWPNDHIFNSQIRCLPQTPEHIPNFPLHIATWISIL